jgi:hypothetical protein
VKIDPSVRSVRPVFGPVIHASRPTRSGRVIVKRRSRSTRTTTPSRGDPDDDPDERSEQTWALTFVDRAPVLWRFRAARCRFEVRPVDGGEVVEHAQVPAAPERGEHDVPADQPGSARDQRLSYAAANTAGEEQSPSHGRLAQRPDNRAAGILNGMSPQSIWR